MSWLQELIWPFHFLRPWWLVAIPLMATVWWLVRNRDGARQARESQIASHLLDALTVNQSKLQRLRPIDTTAVALVFAAVAAAGPTWRQLPNPFFAESSPLVIALEVSDTMLANDIQPSRLERAKLKILDLVGVRAGARTALIAYAGSAHTVLPLTEDPGIIKPFLEGLDPEIMPRKGENAGAALALAQSLLDKEKTPGSILFVNDGIDAADISAFSDHEGAGTVALVFGTERGGVARTSDGNFVRGPGGGRLETGVDPEILERWGRAGGVAVVRADTSGGDIARVGRQIESNLRTALDVDDRAQWDDRGWWFVWPVALLTLLWFRRGWTMQWMWLVAIGGALMVAPGEARAEGLVSWFFTSDQQGRYFFEEKQFVEAGERFENPMWKGVALYRAGRYLQAAEAFARLPTADALFNAGNAYVKGREYARAVAAFEQALVEDPGHADARQNLEIAEAIVTRLNRVRLQEDTGEQSELDADEFKFDKKTDAGVEMVITGQGKLSAESAEQWMRAVDTRTRDFLRTKFALEDAEEQGR